MRTPVLLLSTLLLAGFATEPTGYTWRPQASGVQARLRGVSAVNDAVAWASGADGTILLTTDGGATWARRPIPGGEALDFRDVDAFDARTAYALSIGPGDASRVFKTTDGGSTWAAQFVNADPKAFFDGMAFWDRARGLAISDSVDGHFVILRTEDGGGTWRRVPAKALPPALPGEAAFAASGTSVAVFGRDHAWIGTGAASRARVLRTADGGRTWAIADTPLTAGPSAGIFSIAFSSATDGIVAGGDYKKEAESSANAAITRDGGATWTPVGPPALRGFRSAVAFLPRAAAGTDRTLVAVGPAGTDLSRDGGRTWSPLEGPGFHALSLAGAGGWAVGERGAIGQLAPAQPARAR